MVLYSLEYRKAWKKIANDCNNKSLFMSHNHRNSHSNSNINQYATLADKIEVDESSLHMNSNNSNSISTEQALVDKAEERKLEVELRLLEGEEDRLLKE